MGYLVGAERDTRKCDFADCGNSPFDYTPARVKGKEVVFTLPTAPWPLNKVQMPASC